MEELERKRLHWQKVTAVVCILLRIVVTASAAQGDWAALVQRSGEMLAQAQKSLTAAEEALTAVNDAAEKLDVEGLNTAVTELLAVMQPLAEFFARFK